MLFQVILLIIFVCSIISFTYSRSDYFFLKRLSIDEKQNLEELKNTLHGKNMNCSISYRILFVLNSLLATDEEVTYVSSGNVLQGSLSLRYLYF